MKAIVCTKYGSPEVLKVEYRNHCGKVISSLTNTPFSFGNRFHCHAMYGVIHNALFYNSGTLLWRPSFMALLIL